MSYKDAIGYLESLIPLSREINRSLDPLKRMAELLSELGNPQDDFISIQVSGTSGKGSTSYLLSHVLTNSGYKTGLSTSPHLERATERMQINEKEIDEKVFVSLLEEVKVAGEKIAKTLLHSPTYYEVLLAICFLFFSREKVDIAVIEVGMEGKYDGTNTLTPILGILTNISLDHVEFLGDTPEKIASEAVSFVKKDMTVVTGVTQSSVLKIIEEQCLKMHAPLIVSSQNTKIRKSSLSGSKFSFKGNRFDLSDLSLSLVGNYQVENAGLVLLALEALSQKGFEVDENSIRKSFSTAKFNGRFEHFVVDGVTLILDSAHNQAKMHAFTTELERLYPDLNKIFVIAFKKEKDLVSIFKELHESADSIVISEFHTTIDTSRSATMLVSDVAKRYKELYKDNKFTLESSPEKALRQALRSAKTSGSLVVVTGSMYLVGQIRSLIPCL